LQATQKNFKNLSVQPGLCGCNDLRVGRKMATLQLFFQLGRAKDLSAPLYVTLKSGRCFEQLADLTRFREVLLDSWFGGENS